MLTERRRHRRREITIPAELFIEGDGMFRGRIRDLSWSGAFLEVRGDDFGALLGSGPPSFNGWLMSGALAESVRVRIVYSRPPNGAQGGTGVEFVEPSHAVRARLHEILAQLAAEDHEREREREPERERQHEPERERDWELERGRGG